MDDAEPTALERAYRALILWDEECMQPRLDEQVAHFRSRIEALPPHPVDAFRAAARAETLAVALWFQENEQLFLREAVSYLRDDILAGLRELGVDRQFMQVILGALDEAREALRDRMQEIRDAAGAGDPSGAA